MTRPWHLVIGGFLLLLSLIPMVYTYMRSIRGGDDRQEKETG